MKDTTDMTGEKIFFSHLFMGFSFISLTYQNLNIFSLTQLMSCKQLEKKMDVKNK